MLAKDALDVLALRPGATSAEIKEAYRDMVKVWHPDRFGSDPRLRQKAEDKLKQINLAYQILSSDRGAGEAFAAGPERDADAPSSGRSSHHSGSSPIRGSGGAKPSGISVGVGWLYAGVGITLGLMAGSVALGHRPGQDARTLPAAVQPVEATHEPDAPKTEAMQTPRPGAERDVRSGELPARSVSSKDSVGPSGQASAGFRVRQLSGAETDGVESACSRLKELKDEAGYQTCVRAQLNLITNSGQPDLSALNGVERESIASACSEAKRVHGTGGYNRCLSIQMAEFAAEPARPDMSELSEADRSSIEAACRKAKDRDGPSAYNRCRVGLIKLLAKSK